MAGITRLPLVVRKSKFLTGYRNFSQYIFCSSRQDKSFDRTLSYSFDEKFFQFSKKKFKFSTKLLLIIPSNDLLDESYKKYIGSKNFTFG